MGKRPKEDPKDKAARLRERRITELERGQTAEQSAASLTTDLRAIYGMKGLRGMPGTMPSSPGAQAPSRGPMGPVLVNNKLMLGYK